MPTTWSQDGGASLVPNPPRGGGDTHDVELSELIWSNPRPDETITHVDFVSALKAAGALSVVVLDAHSVQVIIGPQVQSVKSGIEALI